MSATPPLTSRAALPLQNGSRGPGVTDLRFRLVNLGFRIEDEPECFGEATTQAVLAFQEDRGLRPNGVCDQQTWSALVEAGYELGDRLLYRRTPMLRGDDIAELQRRLSALGFDPGTIDGIFGDRTTDALLDFQRNAGVPLDRICGPLTLTELHRLDPRGGATDLISPHRERLRVIGGGGSSLEGRRVGVGESGDFPTGVGALARALRSAGATAFPYHHPDASRNAAEANAAGVECFINLTIAPDEQSCSTAFYRGFRYESAVSRRLAELVQLAMPAALGLLDGGIEGLASPILRETQMPAIDIHLGAPTAVIQRTGEVAGVIVYALSEWIATGAS